jgi:Ca2+-binding EF-hand superfamily protein
LVLSGSAVIAAEESGSAGVQEQTKKKPNGGRGNGNNGNGNGNNGGNGGGGNGGGEDLTRMRFSGMDTNRDGQITREEWRGNDNSFNQHDWNGDGVLSGIEVIPGAERPVDFNSLDRNDDGRISLSEWPGNRVFFNLLDANRDGFLNPAELGQNGALFARGRLEEIFRALDANRDNRIGRTEWLGDLAVFDRLDTNDDGLLTLDELRRLLGGGGDDAENELENLFRRLDTNDDDRISRSEWRGNSRQFDRLDTNDDGFLSWDEFRRR